MGALLRQTEFEDFVEEEGHEGHAHKRRVQTAVEAGQPHDRRVGESQEKESSDVQQRA